MKIKHFILLFFIPFLLFIAYPAQAIVGTIAAFVTAFALAAVGLGAISTVVGTIVGYAVLAATVVFGGMALSKSATGSSGYESPISNSPTYGSGVIQNQTNNNLPVPLPYGNVKCAGNRLWQNASGESTIKRLVAFGYGEIAGYTDIMLNDNNYDASGINATVTQYKGTSSQVISSLIPGSTNAERAEVVGGLKNIAYLAVEVNKSDKVDINYNLTAVVQGLKVNQYTDEDTYTNSFSNNTAWCLLDLLTNYNGLRLGRDANNTFDNDILKEIIDIQSFIDAAAYCDDEIGYYAKTTALTGDDNDLLWQGRASGDNGITITYTDPGTGHATASIAVDVDNNIVVTLANPSGTITTTANDIIDLVNNDSDVSALVRVMSADGNDGTGVVTAMTEQALTLDEAVTRYTFNMIFDSKFSIRDAVEEFKLNCNGAFCVKDGKLQFKIDKPETSKQTFTTKDIKRGSLKEWFEPRGDRYDVLKVEYIDPEYDYSKVEAHIERTTPFNTPIIDHKIQCYSVNNFFHASRLGKLYMLRSELCPRFISFTTGYQAVGRQIGDVITLSYEKGSTTIFDAKLFKIYMMVDNQKGELEIYCREYDERIYSDELGSLEPVVNQIIIDPQAKLRAATFVIAAPDSLNKEQADFIVNNTTGAEVAINQAISQLSLQVVETGTAGTGTTKNSIILDDALEITNDSYNGLYIRFTSGDCINEAAKLITDYVGSTKAAATKYRTEATTTAKIASSTTVEIQNNSSYNYIASSVDDYYNGFKIIVNGQERTITDYVGSTKIATLNASITGTAGNSYSALIYAIDEFTGTPASGDTYEICMYSGSILLLEGVYELKTPILYKSGILVEGLGDGTIVKAGNFYPLYPKEYLYPITQNIKLYDFTININGNSGLTFPGYNHIISGITLRKQTTSYDAAIMDISAAQNVLIQSCRFSSAHIDLGINSTINGNTFSGSSSISGTANGSTISNNQFNKCVPISNMIDVDGSGLNISNNSFYQCGDIGDYGYDACMELSDVNSSIISNNVATGCYSGLIYQNTGTCDNNTITGNSSVSNCQSTPGANDFQFNTANYNNFQNNTVRANPSGNKSDYALLLIGDYNVISNNDLKGSTSYGTATISIIGTGNIQNNNRT